jgi:hypothetical protein
LNPAASADGYPLLYLDEWPNEAAISNRAPIEVHWLDDRDVLTKLNTNNSSMQDLGVRERGLPRCRELARALAQRCLLSLPGESKALS